MKEQSIIARNAVAITDTYLMTVPNQPEKDFATMVFVWFLNQKNKFI